MLATLNQMHEERFADDDARMNDHSSMSDHEGMNDRERMSANEPPLQPDEGERWIADARREASRRKSSRAFIDKHPTLAVAGPYEGYSDEVLFRRYQDGDDAA